MKNRVRTERVFPPPPVIDLEGHPHECGGQFRLAEEDRELVVGQSRRVVPQQFYRCDRCGEETLTSRQMYDARHLATASIRADEQLLSGSEIRAVRERLGLTQDQLERALGLGEKTVVRWETEKVLVPKATDNLLRVIDRDPSALGFLAKRHGVTLPAAAGDASSHAIPLAAGQPAPVQRDAAPDDQLARMRNKTDAAVARFALRPPSLRKAPRWAAVKPQPAVGVVGVINAEEAYGRIA